MPLPMHPVWYDLLSLPRAELGRAAFSSIRYRPDGTEDPGFVLNHPNFRDASILVAGRNFGAGSSREGAVHALSGLGIRVVLATSFGDIFLGNCVKNGLLPALVDDPALAALRDRADQGISFDINLEACSIEVGRERFAFDLDGGLRARLLAGGDEIASTLRHDAAVAAWQRRDRDAHPWVWPPGFAP